MALFVYRRWHVRHADRRIRMDRTDRGCDLSRDRGGCSLLALTLNFGERCRIDDPINGQRSRWRRIVNRLRRRLGPRYRDRRRRLGYRRWPERVGWRHRWRPRRWNRLWTLSTHATEAPVVFRHRKGKPLWTRRSPTWPHRVGDHLRDGALLGLGGRGSKPLVLLRLIQEASFEASGCRVFGQGPQMSGLPRVVIGNVPRQGA